MSVRSFELIRGASLILSILAVCVGASLGALLGWAVSLELNAVVAQFPLGTLVVNLVGGYCIGVAVAIFGNHATIGPEWRLFVITGFLGGFTTFSSFSAEVVGQLMNARMSVGLS